MKRCIIFCIFLRCSCGRLCGSRRSVAVRVPIGGKRGKCAGICCQSKARNQRWQWYASVGLKAAMTTYGKMRLVLLSVLLFGEAQGFQGPFGARSADVSRAAAVRPAVRSSPPPRVLPLYCVRAIATCLDCKQQKQLTLQSCPLESTNLRVNLSSLC